MCSPHYQTSCQEQQGHRCRPFIWLCKGPTICLQVLQVSFPLLSTTFICLIIYNREGHDSNPGSFPTGVWWSYKHSTGTSGLRKHIKNVHLELYIKLCADHNIQPNETIIGKQPSNIELTPPASWEAFSKELLLHYIQNFVVADDQVSFKMNLNIKPDSLFQSINVIKCPEFRSLLLFLQEDLHEEDIPHRDKLRKSIMETWYHYYLSLKDELEAFISPVVHYQYCWHYYSLP